MLLTRPFVSRSPLVRGVLAAVAVLLGSHVAPAAAQESPYFVTYDHHLEEPGNFEIAVTPVVAVPREGRASVAPLLELEYGATAWWTTEVYLAGQKTFGDGSTFTGYRWENRFRVLPREHWINPVLYVEFEHLNEADKTLKEIVGFDGWEDLTEPVHETRHEWERELETKLILSRDAGGWNVSGNLIAEKNLAGEPWEFGYALGVSRPLTLAASPEACTLCAENFSVGLELYGGLGEWRALRTAGTAHYLAPTVAWNLPNGASIRVGSGFGLTDTSNRAIVRAGISYELSGFGRQLANLFH